jgi:SAM-dependent methyltransferase
MTALNDAAWVAEQYKTPTNLHARVQLHRRFGTNPESWFTWVFDRLQLGPTSRVLELGCGSALLWDANRARLPSGSRLTLTDLSPGMVAQAAVTLQGLSAAGFAVADAQRLPFATGSFDVVVANHMLYHVPDRTLTYAEVLRVLAPGGRFFAATNDANHMQEIAALARAYQPELDRFFVTANERYPFDTAFAELGAAFAQLQLHRYANRLVVTDAGALADYMLSGLSFHRARNTVADERVRDFRRWLAAEMTARGGHIEINPATGLFEAVKGA